jgi:hypothetical protein
MAKQDFITFYSEYLPSKPELKSRLDAISDGEEFTRAVLEAGPKAGFSFTREEVVSTIEIAKQALEKGELSEGALEGVAGGGSSLLGMGSPMIQNLGNLRNFGFLGGGNSSNLGNLGND